MGLWVYSLQSGFQWLQGALFCGPRRDVLPQTEGCSSILNLFLFLRATYCPWNSRSCLDCGVILWDREDASAVFASPNPLQSLCIHGCVYLFQLEHAQMKPFLSTVWSDMWETTVLQSPDKTVAGTALSKLYSFPSLVAILYISIQRRKFDPSKYTRESHFRLCQWDKLFINLSDVL